MENIKTLAQRYIQEYKRTPEFGNWDAVIELGKQLADTVLQDGVQTSLPLEIVAKETNPSLSLYGLKAKERELIKNGAFVAAIKSVRERTHLGLKEAKDLCDRYRTAVGAL